MSVKRSSSDVWRAIAIFEATFGVDPRVQSETEKACIQALVDKKLDELAKVCQEAAEQEVTPENVEARLEAMRNFYRVCREAEYFKYEVK